MTYELKQKIANLPHCGRILSAGALAGKDYRRLSAPDVTVKGHSRMGYGKHLLEKLNVTYAVTAATGLLDAEEFKSLLS